MSPRLGIRFELTSETLIVYKPDGSRFLTFVELGQQLDKASQQLDETSQQLNRAQSENAKLLAKLKELGIDPSTL
ncbi:MAG: hypothetical protein AAGN15_04075 [Cyanobacteria bacterium J06581_3]